MDIYPEFKYVLKPYPCCKKSKNSFNLFYFPRNGSPFVFGLIRRLSPLNTCIYARSILRSNNAQRPCPTCLRLSSCAFRTGYWTYLSKVQLCRKHYKAVKTWETHLLMHGVIAEQHDTWVEKAFERIQKKGFNGKQGKVQVPHVWDSVYGKSAFRMGYWTHPIKGWGSRRST